MPWTKYGICFQRVTEDLWKVAENETKSQIDTVSRAIERRLDSNLGLRRGQIARRGGVAKPDAVMGTIAERLVRGLAATAKRYRRATRQSERLSCRIHDLKIPFHANGAVGVDSNFRRSHFLVFSLCGNLIGGKTSGRFYSTTTSRSEPFLTSYT